MSDLRQLVCQCHTHLRFSEAGLEALMEGLQDRQEEHGGSVSGLVLHHEDAFFFCLEGPVQEVNAAMARLEQAGQHHILEVILDRVVARRQFPQWTFASTQARGGGWLDRSTMAWEVERRVQERVAPSLVLSLMNEAWEIFRQAQRNKP